LLVNTDNLESAIPFALEQELDFLLLDSSNGLPGLRGELSGAPDIAIMRRAISQLRALNREEEIDLIYFGGLRTGTDGAKMALRLCRWVLIFRVANPSTMLT